MQPKTTATDQTPKPLAVSIADTGAMLSIKKNLVYDLIHNGELELVHFYGRSAVKLESIEKLVERGGARGKKPARDGTANPQLIPSPGGLDSWLPKSASS